jgi:hypothetical protein
LQPRPHHRHLLGDQTTQLLHLRDLLRRESSWPTWRAFI